MTATHLRSTSATDIQLGTGPVGCFLMHGFTGTTDELGGLAAFLADHGFRVSARLLAGHGTSIEDCNLVRAEDWLEEVEFHFTEFLLDSEAAFVIGLDMGAGLALHLASLFPVAGVVAIAPVLQLASRRMGWWLPLMAPFASSISKERLPLNGAAQLQSDRGYDRYPLNGLRSLLKLNRRIRDELPTMTAPAMIVQADTGDAAHRQNAQLLLDAIPSTHKTLVDYGGHGHPSLIGLDHQQLQADILDFLTRHTPDETHALPVHESR